MLITVPAASQIQQSIPGTTSSNPDGATFLDNLFGSGAYAPTNRLFSMALGRREDVRTGSFLTIGQTSDRLCPPPCSPNYIPVIPQARLGSTGFVHWRIALSGVSATTWSDQENGNGPTVIKVPLGPSFAESTSSSPLAVLDSGGVQILVSRRSYADSLYGAYGITASSDGLCESSLIQAWVFPKLIDRSYALQDPDGFYIPIQRIRGTHPSTRHVVSRPYRSQPGDLHRHDTICR